MALPPPGQSDGSASVGTLRAQGMLGQSGPGCVEQARVCRQLEAAPDSVSPRCTFPFIYKGRSYSSCTTDVRRDKKLWCATTGSYTKDGWWRFCSPMGPASLPCPFLFKHKGKSYWASTRDGSTDRRLWCATTSDYDKDGKWKFCTRKVSPSCTFPFIYKGKSYSACTRDGTKSRLRWCATTMSYDTDGRWRFCSMMDYNNGEACVFPFTYKGKRFSACTKFDNLFGRFWCATTDSYCTDRQWVFCPD
ncbi:epididymal sperm-binding protein 1-like [Terrapene carolina triunguis]|uniref:epididymal sperm-binding protein 1-like n=1 Tax=Terrapene triunguis TaxID=2587831 RepID=UPI0011563B1E|nr:epididymal sperm-binding protein 1-like [Terrapene carolina triunguis]